MRTWRAEPTDAAERLQRLGAPLEDVENRLIGAVDEVQNRCIGGRDSTSGAVAANPLRWTVNALAVGVMVGAVLTHRRCTLGRQFLAVSDNRRPPEALSR